MKCECGRFSLDPVCSYCLAGEGPPTEIARRSILDGPVPEITLVYRYDTDPQPFVPKPKQKRIRIRTRRPVAVVETLEPETTIEVEVGPAYVTPTVERDGLRCPCGEPGPMVAEVFRWVDRVSYVCPPLPSCAALSPERLIWYRCFACGSLTRETLVPASL